MCLSTNVLEPFSRSLFNGPQRSKNMCFYHIRKTRYLCILSMKAGIKTYTTCLCMRAWRTMQARTELCENHGSTACIPRPLYWNLNNIQSFTNTALVMLFRNPPSSPIPRCTQFPYYTYGASCSTVCNPLFLWIFWLPCTEMGGFLCMNRKSHAERTPQNKHNTINCSFVEHHLLR